MKENIQSTPYRPRGSTSTRSISANEGSFSCKYSQFERVKFVDVQNGAYQIFIRDDEEWFEHRQVMNTFMLKDYHWMEDLLQVTCERFISKIKRISDSETGTAVENLEKELYLWSIYCKCMKYLCVYPLNIHGQLH